MGGRGVDNKLGKRWGGLENWGFRVLAWSDSKFAKSLETYYRENV